MRLRAGKRHADGGAPGGASDNRTPCGRDGRPQPRVHLRVRDVEAAADDADRRRGVRVQRAQVRGAVDAAREARHHRHPGLGEIVAEPLRHREPRRGRGPSADHGDPHGTGELRGIAEHEAHRRRFVVAAELDRIAGLAEQVHRDALLGGVRQRLRRIEARRARAPRAHAPSPRRVPHAAATRGSSHAVSRCTACHATRGGHRVRSARRRPGPIIGSEASATAHAVSVAARRRSSQRTVVRDRFDAQLQRDGDVPIGDHVVAAVEVGESAGDSAHSVQPAARQAARLELATEQSAAALRLRGASSSSRDPSIAEFASTPRARATARASATLAATVAEHSPTGGPMSSSTLGRMIGTRRSNRSTRGPETRRM